MPHPCPTVAYAARMLVIAAVGLVAPSASAAAVKTAHVEAELVAAKTALVPGEPTTVALRLVLEKGWHTYWRNPGDSGLPTTLASPPPVPHCRRRSQAGVPARSGGARRLRSSSCRRPAPPLPGPSASSRTRPTASTPLGRSLLRATAMPTCSRCRSHPRSRVRSIG